MLEHNYETYTKNRNWSDELIPDAIPFIYAALGITNTENWRWAISSFMEDVKLSTDILLINDKTSERIMIAFRLRKPKYMNDDGYATQITIRDAEFIKLMGGACDYGFYGFVDEQSKIVRWMVMCWDGFRSVHSLNEKTRLYVPDSGIFRSREKNTAVGDTAFSAYCTSGFLTHDNNLLTAKEDKIIMGHSLGYFEDVSIMPLKYNGKVPGILPVVTIKDKIDRVDK